MKINTLETSSYHQVSVGHSTVWNPQCEIPHTQVALVVKDIPASSGDVKRRGFNPWVRKILWRRAWQPTPVFLPGESPWTEEPGGYSPWGFKELDMTEAA